MLRLAWLALFWVALFGGTAVASQRPPLALLDFDGAPLGKRPGIFTHGVCAKRLAVHHPKRGQTTLALALEERKSATVTARLGGSKDLLWSVLRDFRQRDWWAPSSEIRARYERACSGGDSLACEYRRWHRPEGARRPQALGPMRDACEAGNAVGCLVVGWIQSQAYDYGGKPSDDANNPAEAAKSVERGCTLGLLRACVEWGRLFSYGAGVPKDESRANALYKQACDGGSMRGCSNLGINYATGTGVPQDQSRANALLKQACDGGNMVGCNNLGRVYARGWGVPKDQRRANALYKQACDGGNMVGCNNLGLNYAKGTGVPQDPSRANALFKQACDGGLQEACE